MRPIILFFAGALLECFAACQDRHTPVAGDEVGGTSLVGGAAPEQGGATGDAGAPDRSNAAGQGGTSQGEKGDGGGGGDPALATAGAAGQGLQGAPSCAGPSGKSCGPHHDEDCCTSLPVPGGSFLRRYDGVIATDDSFPATISAFQLDKYEVTVGRFRQFVDAWVTGYRPEPGSGKHTHVLNGHLFNEVGWEDLENDQFPKSRDEWNTALACPWSYPEKPYFVWTPEAGDHETLPMNCITWPEAYAFCIYDGGFLPTDAEAGFASAGGEEQRVYPWSRPPKSLIATDLYAAYDCRVDGPSLESGQPDACALADIPPVGSRSPKGDGRWGHADLGGSMNEWLLDTQGLPAPTNCVDCVRFINLYGAHSGSGGGFDATAFELQVARGGTGGLDHRRYRNLGVRCARSPE